MKTKKFYEPMYFSSIILLLGSYEEYESWLEKQNVHVNEIEKFRSAASFKMDTKKKYWKREYVIWLSEEKDFYTLQHEVFHMTVKIMEDRGIPFQSENHEPYCYLFEYWFRRLWRCINK